MLKMFLRQVRSSCRGFSGLANLDLAATKAAAGDTGAGCDAGDATDGGDERFLRFEEWSKDAYD